jgi:hypothetical protein
VHGALFVALRYGRYDIPVDRGVKLARFGYDAPRLFKGDLTWLS